ncbi:MAG: sialate O-acetylesterase [Verrucomicrobiota bacterium]
MKASLLLACVLMTSVVAGETYNLFLAAGQSNMTGTGRATFFYVDPNGVDDILFTKNEGWGRRFQERGWVWLSETRTRIGPEHAFARTVYGDVPNVAIAKYSVNARSLQDSFRKDADSREVRLYADMIDFWQHAIYQLEAQGHEVNIRALIWLQGTADSRDSRRARRYSINLEKFVTDIRADLNAPEMTFITGRHPAYWCSQPEFRTVRKAQVDVADSEPNAYWVDCDLGTWHRGDRVHYTNDSLELIGVRMAEAYLYNGKTYSRFSAGAGSGIGDMSNDRDFDGRSNLVEYVDDSDPTTADGASSNLVFEVGETTRIKLRDGFSMPADVEATLYYSTDLEGPWKSIQIDESDFESGDWLVTVDSKQVFARLGYAVTSH